MRSILATYVWVLAIGAFVIAFGTGLTYLSVLAWQVSPWFGFPAFLFSIWIVIMTAVAVQAYHEEGIF